MQRHAGRKASLLAPVQARVKPYLFQGEIRGSLQLVSADAMVRIFCLSGPVLTSSRVPVTLEGGPEKYSRVPSGAASCRVCCSEGSAFALVPIGSRIPLESKRFVLLMGLTQGCQLFRWRRHSCLARRDSRRFPFHKIACRTAPDSLRSTLALQVPPCIARSAWRRSESCSGTRDIPWSWGQPPRPAS